MAHPHLAVFQRGPAVGAELVHVGRGLHRVAQIEHRPVGLAVHVLHPLEKPGQFHLTQPVVAEVLRHVGSGVDGIDGRGERRRIGHFQQAEVLDRAPLGDERGGRVHPGGDRVVHHAEGLQAEHPPGTPVEDELEDDHRLVREEMGPVGRCGQGAVGVEPLGPGRLQGEAGGGDAPLEGLHDERTQHPVEQSGLAGHVVGHDPPLAVGQGAERRVGVLAGEQVGERDAVAGGVDVRIRGLQPLVDLDAAERGHIEPGRARQLTARPHAHGHDHQVGRQRPLAGAHRADLARITFDEHLGGLAGVHGHPLVHEVLLEHGGEMAVHQPRQQLRLQFQQGRLHPPEIGESLGHFDADGAAADHHRPADLALGDPLLDLDGLVQVGDGEHPVQVRTGNGQLERPGAGGEHQLVVGQILLRAAVHMFHPHRFRLAVDGQGPGAGAHQDALGVLEKRRVADHVETGGAQFALVADIAAHVVGDAAAAVRDEAVLVDHGDLPVGPQSFQPAGGLGAGRDRTDDDDFFAHGTPPCRW